MIRHHRTTKNHNSPTKQYNNRRNNPHDGTKTNTIESILMTFENVDATKVYEYYKNSDLLLRRDLFDWNKPWILVPNGSFKGYFDWVPAKFRIGPWNPWCTCYLGFVTIWVFYYEGYLSLQQPEQSWKDYKHSILNSYNNDNNNNNLSSSTPWSSSLTMMTYIWSSWYTNFIGFLWTFYITYQIFQSKMGWTSYGMYTVWSYTLIVVRYGFCVMTPYVGSNGSTTLILVNEGIRFPMLVQATITSVLWNGMIGPSIQSQMKTSAMKQSFQQFFGNFLWKQLHVYNLVLAAINGIYGSPNRKLQQVDFVVALTFCLIYAYFYLCVLDRIGVHYYAIFSPRTLYAIPTWTILFACYYLCFPLWNMIIQQSIRR